MSSKALVMWVQAVFMGWFTEVAESFTGLPYYRTRGSDSTGTGAKDSKVSNEPEIPRETAL